MAKSGGSHPGEEKNGPFVGPLYKGDSSKSLGGSEVKKLPSPSVPDPLGLKKVG